MRKEIYFLCFVFAGLLVYAIEFKRSAVQCSVTQIHDYKVGKEALLVEFVQLSEVDSVQITEFVYLTSCDTGSLEENGSWNTDLSKYNQKWSIIEDKEEKRFTLTGTISGFTTDFPDGCESPSRVEMTAHVYTKQGLKEVTLRAYTDEIKTTIIQ